MVTYKKTFLFLSLTSLFSLTLLASDQQSEGTQSTHGGQTVGPLNSQAVIQQQTAQIENLTKESEKIEKKVEAQEQAYKKNLAAIQATHAQAMKEMQKQYEELQQTAQTLSNRVTALDATLVQARAADLTTLEGLSEPQLNKIANDLVALPNREPSRWAATRLFLGKSLALLTGYPIPQHTKTIIELDSALDTSKKALTAVSQQVNNIDLPKEHIVNFFQENPDQVELLRKNAKPTGTILWKNNIRMKQFEFTGVKYLEECPTLRQRAKKTISEHKYAFGGAAALTTLTAAYVGYAAWSWNKGNNFIGHSVMNPLFDKAAETINTGLNAFGKKIAETSFVACNLQQPVVQQIIPQTVTITVTEPRGLAKLLGSLAFHTVEKTFPVA